MTILDIRRDNARALAESVGGSSRFAEKLEMRRQQASHIIGKTPHKGIGHDMARRIEAAFERPIGWLDVDHTNAAVTSDQWVDVPLLQSSNSAGNVRVDGGPISMMRVSKAWLKQTVSASAFEYLALLSMRGDSMEPTLRHGDLLLIDRGDSSIQSDGVYVLSKEGDLFVRRVAKLITGGLSIGYDNTAYTGTTVEAMTDHGLLVMGRVLATWAQHRL